MGRPKKSETGQISTRERILETAMELFAMHGYDAVSIRDITRKLGLNEASLYNHFSGKDNLLAEIFNRLRDRLINPSSIMSPTPYPDIGNKLNIGSMLTEDSRRFFDKVDRQILLSWRILMSSQYKHPTARDTIQAFLLDLPVRHFTDLFKYLKDNGKIRNDIDCSSAARVVAAVFFDFSFRANLLAGWSETAEPDFASLESDLRLIAKAIEN